MAAVKSVPPRPNVVIFLSFFVAPKYPVIQIIDSGLDLSSGSKFSFTSAFVSSNKGKAFPKLSSATIKLFDNMNFE